jgi:nucleotide-binding universal stress UspA family protein
MQTILVPTDFSKAADNALKLAKYIALKTKATIHLANFYSIPMSDYSYPEISMPGDLLGEVRDAAKIEIEKLTLELQAEGYSVTSTVSMGMATDEIIELAGKMNPDLIVIGTTGATGLVNKLIGSNAEHVMENVKQPIILVPQECNCGQLKKIVYLAELKEDDTPVLSVLFDFADLMEAKSLKLLNINTGFFFQPIDENLMTILDDKFGLKKIQLDTVDGADIVEGIDHYLEKHKVDLVVMSTHKKSLLERIFVRSNTDKMALYTKVPLLVYHKD